MLLQAQLSAAQAEKLSAAEAMRGQMDEVKDRLRDKEAELAAARTELTAVRAGREGLQGGGQRIGGG